MVNHCLFLRGNDRLLHWPHRYQSTPRDHRHIKEDCSFLHLNRWTSWREPWNVDGCHSRVQVRTIIYYPTALSQFKNRHLLCCAKTDTTTPDKLCLLKIILETLRKLFSSHGMRTIEECLIDSKDSSKASDCLMASLKVRLQLLRSLILTDWNLTRLLPVLTPPVSARQWSTITTASSKPVNAWGAPIQNRETEDLAIILLETAYRTY